jgi:hypothetical protein
VTFVLHFARALVLTIYLAGTFVGTSRKDREGDKGDVFQAAAFSEKDEQERVQREKRKKRGEKVSCCGGVHYEVNKGEIDPFAIYTNIEPVASTRFLKVTEKDDEFHAVLKEAKLHGETEEDLEFRDAAWKGARKSAAQRDLWSRLESSDLLLEENDEDLAVLDI